MLSLLWLDSPPGGFGAFESWSNLEGVHVRVHTHAPTLEPLPENVHLTQAPAHHPRGKLLLEAATAASTAWALSPRSFGLPVVEAVRALAKVGPETNSLLAWNWPTPAPSVGDVESILEAVIAGAELVFRPGALVELLASGGLPQRPAAQLLLVLPSLAMGRLALHPALVSDPPKLPDEERAALRVQAVLLLVRSLTIPETSSFSPAVRADIARFLHAAYERELRSWLGLRNAQLNMGRTPTWVPSGAATAGTR